MKAMSLPLALLALAAGASAQTLGSQIDKFNRLADHALLTNDIVAFQKVMQGGVTSDFKYVEYGNSMGFKQMVDNMKTGMAMMKKMKSASSKTLSIKASGTGAVAMTVREMSGTIIGPDKKPHTMDYVGTTTDVYRHEGGKWKMASMTWKDEKMMMDGKKVDPSKMGG
jgi:hypothetical protein